MPLISIIMPIYNVENYLEETIGSIIKQTFLHWELICVDDGSKDNSGLICDEFARRDSRIRVLHQMNRGAATARNNGLALARGVYVIFLDADDIFSPELLEAMYSSAIDNRSELVVVGSEWIVEDNGKSSVVHRTNFSKLSQKKNRDYFDMITTVPWNKLVNREWLLKNDIKFQEIPTNNDVFFSLAVVIKAKKSSFVDKMLIKYRYERKDSLTARRCKGETYILDAYEEVIRWSDERNELQEELAYELLNYMLFSLKWYFTDNIYSDEYKLKMKSALLNKKELYTKLADAYEKEKLSSANKMIWGFVTDDDAVCMEGCDLYVDELHRILCEYGGKRIAIWGCGKIGKQVIDAINKMNKKVDYIVDSNIDLQGKKYRNYIISSYESVKDKIDVVVASGIGIYRDVCKQCENKTVIDIYSIINS